MTGALAGGFVAGGAANIAITLTPSAVAGYSDTGSTANVTTGGVEAVPTGGRSPYTYSWARKGTSAYTWTIGASTASITDFTAQSVPVGVSTQATFELTVTDAAGSTAKKQITATARNKVTFDDRGGTA